MSLELVLPVSTVHLALKLPILIQELLSKSALLSVDHVPKVTNVQLALLHLYPVQKENINQIQDRQLVLPVQQDTTVIDWE